MINLSTKFEVVW